MATITTGSFPLDTSMMSEFDASLSLFHTYASTGVLPGGATLVSRSATQVVLDDSNGLRLTFTGTFAASGSLNTPSFLLTGVSAATPGALNYFTFTGLSVNQAGISGPYMLDNYLAGNDSLTGGAADDHLYGGSGNDSINGGVGADSMEGGMGDDTYVVDNAGDTILDMGGTDTVQSSVTFGRDPSTYMGPPPQIGIENIVLTGASAIDAWGFMDNNTLTGNSAANRLYGGGGNDLFDGGTGSDTMTGGGGNDTYILDVATDVVVDSGGIDTVKAAFTYVAPAFIENVTLTGTAAINATGNASDNILVGNSAANVLDGGIGMDAMTGGYGDDTYYVDSMGDQTIETATGGKDTVILTSGAMPYTLANNLENLTFAGTGNATLTGNVLNNVITGGAGNDQLAADSNPFQIGGADTMIGGLGNDTYTVFSSADVVTEASGGGTDTVNAWDSYVLSSFVENLDGSFGPIMGKTLTGNDLGNIITGDVGNNLIDGKAGNDTMSGGIGNDTYVLDSVGDIVLLDVGGVDQILFSGAGAVSLAGTGVENVTLSGTATNATGNELNNTMVGNAGTNVLSGDLGDDWLDGGAGNDTLAGGVGMDTYVVDSAGDVIVDSDLMGSTVLSSVSFDMSINPGITTLTLTGVTAINGTGNALDNVLNGNDGANRLDGGAGMDAMFGGKGNDTYVVDNIMDMVGGESDTSATGGVDEILSGVSFSLNGPGREGIEKLTFTNGGTGGVLTGNALANTLTGNAGNDLIDGQAGADTMAGGLGDDFYIVDNAGDSITEAADAGYDVIESSVSYVMGLNTEQLELSGGDLNGTGNIGNNYISGSGGANRIDGGAGADTMEGASGNDTYIVDNTGDMIFENGMGDTDEVQSSVDFVLDGTGDPMMPGTGVENLVLTGTAISGWGSAADNRLTGNASANLLYGGEGNDTLDGGAGADTLYGGNGDDLYIVDNVGDVVVDVDEGIAQGGSPMFLGNDRIESSVTYSLYGTTALTLTLTGTGANNATGNAANNWLYGNSGNNLIDGQLGADTMAGGAGNDTFIVNNSGDVVSENLGEGTDLVRSSVNYNLSIGSGVNVENLELTGTDGIWGIGNALANSLTGNDGANYLDGGVGVDTMIGGKGDDTYYVDNTGDVVTESVTNALGGGSDVVVSRVSYVLGANLDHIRLEDGFATALNATGNAEANRMAGNEFNNVLDGGAGNDSMSGGMGNDTYFVDSSGDFIAEAVGNGNDKVVYQASASFSSATVASSDIENIEIRNTLGTFTATGNAMANTFDARGSTNTMMIGGDGDDTYYVDSSADAITESASPMSMHDVVYFSGATGTYTLSAEIEELNLTGVGAINGTGNALANVINGNAGNNILDGGANPMALGDTMTGGLGNDTYIVDDSFDKAYENFGGGVDTVIVKAANYSIDYLFGPMNPTNIEVMQVDASVGAGVTVTLQGNIFNQSITGHAGADIIDGRGGADIMTGLAGNDTYYVDNLGDRVIEAAAGGTADTVHSTVSYILPIEVEDLYLDGAVGNLRGTGNALANHIYGNMMDNVLDGRGGIDTMDGGMGNDVYIVDNAGDVINDTGADMLDTVIAQANYTLTDGSGVENIRVASGTADNINITGNSFNNVMRGNQGNNILDGGNGNDLLDGGIGNDTLIGGNGDDTYIIDSTGDVINETGTITSAMDWVQTDVSITSLWANVENVSLNGGSNLNVTGNALANVINGNSGQNVIDGGGGVDSIYAGGQNDRIVFDAADALVDGQGGFDTLSFASGSVANLDLTLLNQFHGIEVIDMTSASANTLTLSASDVLDVSNGPDPQYNYELWIKGDNADTVNFTIAGADTGWSYNGIVIDRGYLYRDFSADANGTDTVHVYVATNVLVP